MGSGAVDAARLGGAPTGTDPAQVPGPLRLPASTRRLGAFAFSLLSVLLGLVAGFGAYGFRALIALVHNAAFLGRLAVTYDSNIHTPAAPWGLWVVLVPVVGAMAVSFLVGFAPETRGHGVPEVMDAIYSREGAGGGADGAGD